jgi:hypothetical protein
VGAEIKNHPFSSRALAWTLVCILLGGLLILISPSSQAQSMIDELKAQYIERFPGFIEWPSDSSVADPTAPFIIGVIGRTDLNDTLEGIARRTMIKGKPIEIHQISSLGQINRCQILFIARTERGRLGEVLGQVGRRPILTIGDTDGFASRGVIINFIVAGESLRFQINRSAAEAAGLKVSDKLLALGDEV